MGRGAFTTPKCLCDLGGAFLLEADWWNEAKILTLTQDPTIAHEVYYLLERARAEVINLCQENGWTEDETSERIRPIDELQYYLGLYLRLGKEQAGRVRRRVEDWLRKEANEWDLLELAYRSGVSLD
jgi:acyl-CoA synthetase (AMP-forming)/AMP-acid ligase II